MANKKKKISDEDEMRLPGLSLEPENKQSCTIWIIIIVVFLAMFLSVGKHLTQQGSSGLSAELKTPVGAVKAYIQAVETIVRSDRPVGADHLLKIVTKDDRKWYFNNQNKIYEARRGQANKFIGYNSSGAMEESAIAIRELLAGSPNRADALIESEKTSGKTSTIVVKQGSNFGFSFYTIDLVRERKLWKVKGFCGARKQMEREIAGL